MFVGTKVSCMSRRIARHFAIALTAYTPLAQARSQPLPADVAAFVVRRDACDHFRGEEPYDRARAEELNTKLAKTCTGTDRELAALRRKYAGQRKVVKRLSHYEERIE